jgi:hypothetical protein
VDPTGRPAAVGAKLDVLREHCDREGADNDRSSSTMSTTTQSRRLA